MPYLPSPKRSCQLAALLLLAHLATVSAYAANYYWDTNGATAGFGTAGGTWAAPTPGPTTGWSTDSTGASAIGSVTTAHGDSTRFGTDAVGLAAGTITISGTVSTSNLFFGKGSGPITLTGDTISLATGGSQIRAHSGSGSTNAMTIDNDIAKLSGTLQVGRQNTIGEDYIFNGVISGATGMDLRPRNGAAYVAFNGVNTFPANIGLVTGQLNVNTVANSGVACSLGTGSTITMGGFGGQQPLLWYTGAGAGSTNRTIRAISTSSSRIVAQDGALDLTGSLTTHGGGTYPFQFNGTADTGTNTVSGVISDGSGTIRVVVAHTTPQHGPGEQGYWRFTGVNTYTGTTTVQNSSRIIIDGAGQLGSGTYASAVNINGNGTFEYSSTANQTITGTVQGTGTGGLVKSDSGMLSVYMNTGMYSGPTTVEAGTLQFVNQADLRGIPGSPYTINGGTLEIQSSVGGPNRTNCTGRSFTFGAAGGGTINFNNGNHLFQTWATTNFVTTGGSKNIISRTNGGFMNMQGGVGTYVVFTVADGADDVDLEYSCHWNNGQINKSGAGTMSITGSHGGNYPIVINAGTLEVGGSTTLVGGTFTSTITNAATFGYNSTANQTISGVISGAGNLVKDNTSTLTLTAANSYTGTTDIDDGTLEFQTTSGFVNFVGGDININNGSTVRFVRNGGNGYVLDAADTINFDSNGGGLLDVDSASSINFVVRGSTITTAGGAENTIQGTFNMDSGDVIFNVSAGDDPVDLTVSAVLSNSQGIVKQGAGTMELSATNNYSGTTTVSAGTLSVTGATGSGDLTVASGATLKGTGTIGGPVTISGTLSPGL